MQKAAPSIGRILVAVGFALSCFGLLLFLWIAFGGPIPLKPTSYRVTAYLPEGTNLAQEADVRIGGVTVGKVKTIELAPIDKRINGKDTSEAEIEIEPEFAPISRDARAILRAKTLLGETYVELTPGTEPGNGKDALPVSLGAAANVSDAEARKVESIEEGGTLGIGRTREAVQIDEIFNALDEETRNSFRNWMRNAAVAVRDRGQDLNDAFGNLGPFLTDLSGVVDTLRRQRAALKGVVRDTGAVFEALTENESALAGTITGTEQAFEALASEDEALAETFQLLPTFQRESRLTFERLDRFQADTRPLIQDLIPVARELSPTLRSVRRLSPHLRDLFPKLDQLIDVSDKGLPAARDTFQGLRPLLDALDPFLANLNPLIRYLGFQKETVSDFFTLPGFATAGTAHDIPDQNAPRHGLRQVGMTGAESLGIHQTRLATNRGNAYKAPFALSNFESARSGIFANWDCKNLDYSPVSQDQDEDVVRLGDDPPADVNRGDAPSQRFAPCYFEGTFPGPFGNTHLPWVTADP